MSKPDEYWVARWEHAWLLRAEGRTYREIGKALGVSIERARQMVWRFGECVTLAMKKAKKHDDDRAVSCYQRKNS